MLEVLAPAGMAASRLLLVGLGKPELLDEKGLETLGAQIVGPAACGGRKQRARSRSMCPRGARSRKAELAAHLAFGARLKSYAFDKYRTRNLDEYEKKLKTLRIVTPDVAAAKKAHAGLAAVADGIFLARDLVNEPPNILYPAEFARRAKAQLAKLGVKVEILGEAEMKKQGFGALLGVGQGSDARKPAGRHAMEWRQESRQAHRAGGQGRVFRFRRPVDQGRRRHAGHEGRHGGRRLPSPAPCWRWRRARPRSMPWA